ncbi:LruC domain-containing protein [Cyclonatronum proteinivorum]|uniref:LruC domain-containing protein n=1 Tax=Cyclonatronum proteinivorum TaxID=1457365 RepID=A0A345UFY6_9BACT|nr:LruC domain-containing protein [Cyclonatronum proteinivorum]AXI99387.1 LruC domain-containing protein [Cyclonatronum proteinivorum]
MKNNITSKTAGLAVLFAGMLLLSSCDTVSTSNDDPTGAFTVPKGFNFQTTTNVTLNLRASDIAAGSTVIRVYDGHPFMGGNIIRETPLTAGQSRTLNLSVGAHAQENLWVLSTLPSGLMSAHKVELSGSTAQVNVVTKRDESESDSGMLRGTFDDPGNHGFVTTGETAWAGLHGTGYTITNDFELGNTNFYENLCWVFAGGQVNGPSPITGQRAFQTQNPTENSFPNSVTTPWIEFNGTGTITFNWTQSGNPTSRRAILGLYYSDVHGNADTANPLYIQAYSANQSGVVMNATVDIPAHLTGVRRLVWNFLEVGGNNRGSLDDIVISGTLATTGAPACAPTGGSANQTEFVNHYPAANVFGTLAFEDNWPGFGDYDMNDLVLGYNIREITNANDEVIRIEMTHQIRAIGGVLRTGFGYQFPFEASAVASVNGQRLNTSLVSNDANGTEAGQDSAVVILWDNSTENMPTFSNVVPGRFTEYDVIESTITFNNPVPKSEVGNAPYNPFIFVHGIRNGEPFGGRGHEVHLKGMPPTSLADENIFGDASDASDPENGLYYQSKDGLNWAIHIPVPFVYPRSQTAITDAYTNFKAWAENGGTAFPDWYVDVEGNLNEEKVYRRPQN